MIKHNILEGLHPYGDLPRQFSATGLGTHREGFVVQFCPKTVEEWVGNFQRGMGSLEGVYEHPDQTVLAVVAGGQGYVVDVGTRSLKRTFGGMLETVFEVRERQMLVFGDRTEFQAFGSSGLVWRSARISWDGFYALAIEGDELVGEAFELGDVWLTFKLDLRSGHHEGGAMVE
jgi:hypothetical protein